MRCGVRCGSDPSADSRAPWGFVVSTRSIIGTAIDNGFVGRYCHWDGYPSGRGPLLAATYAECNGNVSAVRAWCLREGSAGYWSSFASPRDVMAEARKPVQVACDLCAGTGTRPADAHWEPGSAWAIKCGGCNVCHGSGLRDNPNRLSSWCADNGDGWVVSDEDCGAEWAYLLGEDGVSVLCHDMDADGSGA